MGKVYFSTGDRSSVLEIEDRIETNNATKHYYQEYFSYIKISGLSQESIDEKMLGFESIDEFPNARNNSSDPELQQKIELKIVPGILALGFYAKLKSSRKDQL